MTRIAARLSRVDAAGAAMARAGWSADLFAARPDRRRLQSLVPQWPLRRLHVHVIRNQPFELVAQVIRPFLAFAGLEADFSYSDYDDSLMDVEDHAADVVLVWLDFRRYSRPGEEVASWLVGRLREALSRTRAPFLVCGDTTSDGQLNGRLQAALADVAGGYLCPQWEVASELGADYLDSRMLSLAGGDLSGAAAIETARRIGLQWIPAVVQPGIKAVAVDADATLYDGVVAEDGVAGVRVTAAHGRLHEQLLSLRSRGIMLTLVSRNELEDLERLFSTRPDIKLRLSDFSTLAVNWNAKSEAILAAAAQLKISADSMLLVDDNPGELAAVAAAIPGVHTLHGADPGVAAGALTLFPGLFRFTTSAEDLLRIDDLRMGLQRQEAIEGGDDATAYLSSLGLEVDFRLNHAADAERLHALSTKTNQFNTSLARLSAAEVSAYIHDPDRAAVAVGLRDRLSDSGVVGALFFRAEGGDLLVEEVAISCRALGRLVEGPLIDEGIRVVAERFGVERVRVRYHQGPRNQPALAWLESRAGALAAQAGWAQLTPTLPADGPGFPVRFTWRDD